MIENTWHHTNGDQPWRCLWRGSREQMIRMIPFLLITWQNWHLRLIDALTFMFFHPFHKIAKHATITPSPDPDSSAAVLHGPVARILLRRSLRFFDFILGRCGAVEWNSPQNLPESWLSYKILLFQDFFKFKNTYFSKKSKSSIFFCEKKLKKNDFFLFSGLHFSKTGSILCFIKRS